MAKLWKGILMGFCSSDRCGDKVIKGIITRFYSTWGRLFFGHKYVTIHREEGKGIFLVGILIWIISTLQDDLAGIGRGCPHQNFGQTSCISGGRIDASCCVDSHFKRGCHYQPGIINGVLCCRMPGMSLFNLIFFNILVQ